MKRTHSLLSTLIGCQILPGTTLAFILAFLPCQTQAADTVPFKLSGTNYNCAPEDCPEAVDAFAEIPFTEGASFSIWAFAEGTSSQLGKFIVYYRYDMFTIEIDGLELPYFAAGHFVVIAADGSEMWGATANDLTTEPGFNLFEGTMDPERGTGRFADKDCYFEGVAENFGDGVWVWEAEGRLENPGQGHGKGRRR